MHRRLRGAPLPSVSLPACSAAPPGRILEKTLSPSTPGCPVPVLAGPRGPAALGPTLLSAGGQRRLLLAGKDPLGGSQVVQGQPCASGRTDLLLLGAEPRALSPAAAAPSPQVWRRPSAPLSAVRQKMPLGSHPPSRDSRAEHPLGWSGWDVYCSPGKKRQVLWGSGPTAPEEAGAQGCAPSRRVPSGVARAWTCTHGSPFGPQPFPC